MDSKNGSSTEEIILYFVSAEALREGGLKRGWKFTLGMAGRNNIKNKIFVVSNIIPDLKKRLSLHTKKE